MVGVVVAAGAVVAAFLAVGVVVAVSATLFFVKVVLLAVFSLSGFDVVTVIDVAPC